MSNQKFNSKEERDRVIERIKFILARANGTPYEGEAKIALDMAQKYMARYGLSLTDVELHNELSEEIIEEELTEHANRKDPEKWESVLSMAVAYVFDCKAIRNMRYHGSKLMFIGYRKDVEMAKIIFGVLYVASRAAACKQFPDPRDAGLTRLSFMYGVSTRLLERAHEEKEKAVEEPTGRYGLVVVEKSKRIDLWTKERHNLEKGKQRASRLHVGAYEKGRSHANTLDLMNREKVERQAQPAPLRLT